MTNWKPARGVILPLTNECVSPHVDSALCFRWSLKHTLGCSANVHFHQLCYFSPHMDTHCGTQHSLGRRMNFHGWRSQRGREASFGLHKIHLNARGVHHHASLCACVCLCMCGCVRCFALGKPSKKALKSTSCCLWPVQDKTKLQDDLLSWWWIQNWSKSFSLTLSQVDPFWQDRTPRYIIVAPLQARGVSSRWTHSDIYNPHPPVPTVW